MTQNRRRGPRPPEKAPEPPAPVSDPLAALRDPDDDTRALPQEDPQEGPGEALEDEQATDGPEVHPLALVTQEAWDEARDLVIVAWHNDTTAVGFLHKGGACGCRYLAGAALRVVMPVQPEGDDQDTDTEDNQDLED